MIRQYRLAIAAAATLIAAPAPAQQPRDYSPVTDSRLGPKRATGHVSARVQLWSQAHRSRRATSQPCARVTMSTGTVKGTSSADRQRGVIIATTLFNQVIAIDAKTGDLWRYRH
jgi:hypothetical protein